MATSRDRAQYQPSPGVLAHQLGQDMILLHLRTDRFYELSGTAARVWQLLSAGSGPAELQQQLLQEFAVEEAQLLEDLTALFAQLLAEDLIRTAACSEKVSDECLGTGPLTM